MTSRFIELTEPYGADIKVLVDHAKICMLTHSSVEVETPGGHEYIKATSILLSGPYWKSVKETHEEIIQLIMEASDGKH